MDQPIVLHQPHPKHPNSLNWFWVVSVFWQVVTLTPYKYLVSSFERMPIRAVALSQLSAFVNPLVIMSADCSWMLQYLMSIWSHVRNTSLSQAKFTRCVRAIWRNAGFLPDLRICIVAWLSSNKVAITFRSNTMSHNWNAGNPSRRTISASGRLCETHVCF